MDKKTIYLSLALGIVANMIYGSLIYFSKIPNVLQTILMTILLLILPLFIIFYYRMTRYGISNIWDASTNKFSLINQLKSSNSSMKFLGVSARTIMEPQVESKIVEKLLSNNEFNVKFLVFDRNETEKLKRRAYEETGDQKTSIEWKEIMSSTIQMILRIKKDLVMLETDYRLEFIKHSPPLEC